MNFDEVAQNLAEVIDSILSVDRDRERRIELIRHHVRRALVVGYREGKGKTNGGDDERE